MANTLLRWLHRDVSRHTAWAQAWLRYGLAWVDFRLRARGVRPLPAIIGVLAVFGFGAVVSAAMTGWPVPIGLAARQAQNLQAVQEQLVSTERDLSAARAALAKLAAEQAAITAQAGPVMHAAGDLADAAKLKIALQDADKHRRAARALYQQALATLAKDKKQQAALAALNLRLEHRIASLQGEQAPAEDASAGTGGVSSGPADVVADDSGDSTPAPFDLRRFLAKLGVRPAGEGGPFIPAGSMRHGGADPAAMRILRSLPLKAPLNHYVVASPFGVRADPINEHQAFHTGVDLDAPYRSPVYNTAPGVVVFAGWAGAYGRMVEIDHGHGIHTRYCHLNRITVTVGEHLRRRVRIGLLGSTGRSTGPHVHYEVRVNGVPEDPERFLQAGRSVVLVGDGP